MLKRPGFRRCGRAAGCIYYPNKGLGPVEIMLENAHLRACVRARGAELCSVLQKDTGRECLWQGDPVLWPRQAPLLFPYCGRIKGNTFTAKGKTYPGPVHGFAQDMDFTCEEAGVDFARFVLYSSPETKEHFPYTFCLRVEYCLQGNTLRQSVTVHNPDLPGGDTLPFSLGFHPGFALPLAPGSRAADCEFVFDTPQTPLEVKTPEGFVSGETHVFFENAATLPLRDELFENDSICLSCLTARSLALRDKKSGRFIKVQTEGFPYVLLWGPPQGPLPFVCIEPWHSLPDPVDSYGEFAGKPGLTLLPPGESYTTALQIEFG